MGTTLEELQDQIDELEEKLREANDEIITRGIRIRELEDKITKSGMIPQKERNLI